MRTSAAIVLVVAVAGSFLGGCASERMLELKTTPVVVSSPPSGKATMVYFRSSFFGGAVQSSVFDVSDNNAQLVGIISAGRKIAYTISPGQHRFMAIGESADFLDVNAGGGKIYYARVSPRMGLWKTRFVLEPVPATESGLAGELAECSWVENTKASRDWATTHMSSILGKKAEYLPEWEKSADRKMLKPEDGK